MINCLDHAHGRDFAMYRGDCVEVLRQLPENSIDFSVFSPPFSSLYTYSDNDRDMGNVGCDAEFFEGYRHVARELYRVIRPMRLIAVHCSDIPMLKQNTGKIGLSDFSGQLVRAHQEEGWLLHSKITIWKDPVTEMQRTKSIGLLYKQLRKDSAYSRVGLPDYMLIFRKWDESHPARVPVTKNAADFPVGQWQQYASPVWKTTASTEDPWHRTADPVWMDINQSNTMNARLARGAKDEKHMCPLQLDVIDRCIRLWTNPGEVVLSPFGGVGSEGVGALRLGRKFVGIELKGSYFERAVINLRQEEGAEQMGMFG